jgi:hypothetical protein
LESVSVGNATKRTTFQAQVGALPMDDDRERVELRRLRDKFLEIMRRQNELALIDEAARQRVGEAISRSTRRGRSEFLYSNGPTPRR